VVVTEEFVPDAPHLVVGGHVLVICCGRSGFGYCSGWWSGASWKATPDVVSFLGDEPAMLWGSSIVGFGSYDYRYESGHEGTSALAGFAPRKPHLVIYLVGGSEDKHAKLMADLGPHKTGKGCLYVKRLADVDPEVLRDLIDRSVRVRRGGDRAAHRER
jgi:hypothetical protein